MARYNNHYSRFVTWAKIILPVIALILLSSLFLVSNRFDPKEIPFISPESLKNLAEGETLTKPKLATVISNGSKVSIVAESFVIGGTAQETIDVIEVVVSVENPSNLTVEIRAPFGSANTITQKSHLFGDIEISTSDGMTLKTAELFIALDKIDISSLDTTSIIGPNFNITAGKMAVIARQPADQQFYVLDFTNGVKLIYDPKQ